MRFGGVIVLSLGVLLVGSGEEPLRPRLPSKSDSTWWDHRDPDDLPGGGAHHLAWYSEMKFNTKNKGTVKAYFNQQVLATKANANTPC